MPVIDLPLEQLLTYRGRNPRPADFDAYWDEALRELRSVDPDLALKPSGFQSPSAECFDLWFTGVRGARVHAKYARPREPSSPLPALLCFHGYSANAGEWTELLAQVAAGFCVCALDCRGQGGLSEDTGGVKGTTLRGHIVRGLDDDPRNLLFRQIFLDAVQLAGLIADFTEVDPQRLCATGRSQGGGLTLACAALEPRIKRLAYAFPFLSDYQRVWEMDLAKGAYEELREFFRRFDPTHAREQEIFGRLGYIDVQHLAGRIQGRTLFAVGLMDEICPPSSQFAAYNAISAPKELVIYPDFAHEDLPGWPDRCFQFFLEQG
ncbi:MAG: alpha/beta fold hydrolase [Rectinemataceae bacterium]